MKPQVTPKNQSKPYVELQARTGTLTRFLRRCKRAMINQGEDYAAFIGELDFLVEEMQAIASKKKQPYYNQRPESPEHIYREVNSATSTSGQRYCFDSTLRICTYNLIIEWDQEFKTGYVYCTVYRPPSRG